MDRSRRDLYVEGLRDKAFLEWLCRDELDTGAQVIIADFIDVPDVVRGGNRARILFFLDTVLPEQLSIRGLVDADNSRLVEGAGVGSPNLWVTDHRDLEAYVLDDSHVDTAIRAGCGVLSVDARAMYQSAVDVARFMAAIRVLSERDELGFPVSAGKWLKHVSADRNGVLSVNRSNVTQALMQGGGMSLKRLSEIEAAVTAEEARLREVPDRDVVHGKDFGLLFTKQLDALGVKIDSASRLLLATFPRESHRFAVLEEIESYLRGEGVLGGAAA